MGWSFLPMKMLALFLFLFAATEGTTVEEYDERPRIVLENGHMHLIAAEDRSIKFLTSTGGKIFFNDYDVLAVVHQAAEQTRAIVNFRQEVLQRLEERLSNLDELGPRIAQLEQVIANGSSSADVPGSVGPKLKNLTQRIKILAHLIRQIQTLLNTNECNSNPCRNGGTCEDTYNGFLCRCPENWEGVLCDRDVNECAHFAGTDLGCQNGGTCQNTPGSYTCHCASNWRGVHCTIKNRGCSGNNVRELCGHGACIDQDSDPQGYICICDQGWQTDGFSKACTQDVDECASAHPACSKNPSVYCINTLGSFRCGPCPRGFTGNGYYCTDIDECQTNNRGGCSNNPFVPCINTQGSFTCGQCPAGYQGDGFTCSYIGACRINNGGCHPLAQCIENAAISQAYVHCVCPSGYEGSGMGPLGCTPSSSTGSPCRPNPCVHGDCVPQGSTFTCWCHTGYTGQLCNIEVNACEGPINPCQNGGTCVSQGTSYICQCPSAYSGDNCEVEQLSCGGTLFSAFGTLKYPAGPSSRTYPRGMSCSWLIIVNETKVINVSFNSFHLEASPDCIYDWLQIHDGRNTDSQSRGRFCGTTIPQNITSTHNMLYLWFRSDHSNQGDGFELTWNAIEPVCGGRINFQSHGTLSSPGYPGKYPPNRDCDWTLIAPSGKRIQLHFFTMNIGINPNCSFDSVLVLDGYGSQVLGRYCNSTLPAPLTVPNNRAIIRFHSDNIGRDTGFQISYSATQSSDCGGILTDPQGRITSPLEPGTSRYQHRLFCEWEITLPEGETIQLTFERMALENEVRCRFDYVEVRAGRGPDAPLAFHVCGTQLPRKWRSPANVVTVIFRSDHSIADEGFIIQYEAICGGTFGDEAGHITSPMYPLPYPRDKTCIYEIVQPLGRSITLNFQDFDLEGIPSRFYRWGQPRCLDYVEIHDGHDETSRLLGKYCGTDKPNTIVSTYNYLWIKFHSDFSIQKRGFYANYTTEDVSCGGIVREESGIIQSPNYPSVYPNDHDCRWVIVADEGHVISLEWLDFSLEMGCHDDVTVYQNISGSDVGQLIGTHCSHNLPLNITSTSNILTIVFKTDYSLGHRGFQVRYFQQNAQHICNANFVAASGTITSPNYPGNYPSSKDCVWRITVPVGQQITLNITDFELEYSGFCGWDYLEIRNGGAETSPLIGKYCGASILSPIVSHSHQLYIHFVSDHSRSGRGFNMTWDGSLTGCGGVLRGKTGHIISPNHPQPYGRNAQCSYKIITSRGSIVQVVFLDFDIESSHGCMYDYLAFYDGEDSSAKLLGRYCSDSHPALVRSTSNKMFIKFSTDSSAQGRGFSIKYDTVCETTVSGFHGVIESPNFPNAYPRNIDCQWMISVPKGNKINITFSHFEVENSISCRKDYVQVNEKISGQDFYTSLGSKLCGYDLPAPLSSNSNSVKIDFHSDIFYVMNGFRLEWLLNGCGGQFTSREGKITSPGYPQGYSDSVNCEWKITIDLGKSIELTLEDFDVEGSQTCNMDFLIVYGGPDAGSPKLHDALCHSLSSPMVFTSSGNNMFLQFFADFSYSGRGFRASYKAVDSVCGGIFKAPNGNIHSHNYPQSYDPHDDCIWYIEVEKNHVVKLTFMSFDLELNNNCSYDYVKVFDGNTTDSPVLATLCGNTLPNVTTYVSTGNTMTVRMKADGSSNGFSGFWANYSTACGARILAEDDGIIELSPAINANPADNANCSWIITALQPSDQITLTVTHMSINTEVNSDWRNDCDLGYLEVFDGDDKNATRLGQYCGTRIPPTIVSHGSSLMLHLVSTYWHHYGYFSASYSVLQDSCGGNLTSEHGAITSPSYPESYPLNIECVWSISASQGNRVMLSFRSFGMEESDGCNKDYLEVRESGPIGNLIGVYCSDLPINITATQVLWIKFYSDNDTTGAGFIADYSLLLNNELSGPTGQVASPLYPRPYVIRGNPVTWRISVDFGFAIRISFENFFIEKYSAECHDYLAIYDGYDQTGPLLMKKCGSILPDPVSSSSNIIFIEMNAVGFRGSLFLLNWMQIEISQQTALRPAQNIDGCGGNIYLSLPTPNNTESEYTLTSPGFPEGYRSDMTCEWIVESPPGYQTAIKVNTMDLETYDSCHADFVNVYQGDDGPENWKLVKTWCLTNASSEPPLSGGSLTKITFRSDFSHNRTGFSLKLFPACGGTIKASNGVIEVNNLTQGVNDRYSVVCEWNITVRSGRRIRVTFDRFSIPVEHTLCRFYLTLRNGHFRDSPVLGRGKYCGRVRPEVNETTGNHLSVKYSARWGGQGFKMRFREVSEACGGSFTLTSNNNLMEVSSPRFPNAPPAHSECIWTFIAPGGEALQVDFDTHFDFDHRYKANCPRDYVELRDGGTSSSALIGRFCIHVPSTQKTTGNVLWMKYFTDVDSSHSGFKANVSLARCGGVIRTGSGVIRSPGYPQGYPRNVQCIWRFEHVGSYKPVIQFQVLDLPWSLNCERSDRITISQILPDSRRATPLTTVCGSVTSQIPEISTPIAVVNFTSLSSGSDHFTGFLANYSFAHDPCSGELNTPFGVIRSPGYPSRIRHRFCTWKITVPLGRRITVNIVDIDLELGETFMSNLMFYETSWQGLINDLSRNRTLRYIESSGNTMFIYLYTRSYGSRFWLTYSSALPAVCGGSLDADSGSLDLPLATHAARTYYCEWQYTRDSPSNKTLAVIFRNVTLNYERYLLWVLKIKVRGPEENQIIKEIHQNYTDSIIVVSPFPRTYIMACQTALHSTVTFSAEYKVHSCGGIITSEETITSLGYPNNYPNNLHCAWSVNFPEGSRIKVHFNDFALEGDCNKDYVILYNGALPTSPALDRLCAAIIPQDFVSQSNSLWIEFHSNNELQFKGFNLTVSAVTEGCGGTFHQNNSVIASPQFPNKYPDNAECEWDMRVENGFHIKLRFIERFQIEDSPDCTKDFVEVYDYVNGNYVFKNKFCGRNAPAPVESRGSRMRVRFRSNDNGRGDGFKAVFSKLCGGIVENITQGQLISPGYPEPYVGQLFCNYTVLMPGNLIRVQFESFDLERSPAFEHCYWDYVKITYRRFWGLPTELGRFCGTDAPPSFVAKDQFSLIFKTDSSVNHRGFLVNFRSNRACGGDIREPGTLSSPEVFTPNMYDVTNCTWVITAPENSVVVVRFSSLFLTAYASCDPQRNGIILYDGPSVTSPVRGVFCGDLNLSPPVVRSTGNQMVLTFLTYTHSPENSFGADILFTYGESVGCGGSLNISSGSVKTVSTSTLDMNHDGNYEPSLDCHWTLTAAPNQVIRLRTTQFDLIPCVNVTQNSSRYCTCDFLEIRDGGHQYADLFGKFCGTAGISLISSSNQLWIRLKTDGENNGHGFTLEAQAQTSPCSMPQERVATLTPQVLTSPNYPDNYPANIRCQWLISVPRYERVAIHIEYLNITGDEDCSTSKLQFSDEGVNDVVAEGNVYYGRSMSSSRMEMIYASTSPLSTYSFCGEIEPFNYFSNMMAGSVTVSFLANENVAKGFNLTYSKPGCNRNYTALSGRIHVQDPDGHCFTVIETTPNRTISLYFSTVHSDTQCENSGLEVNDGATASDPNLARICGYNIPSPVFSTGNALWLHMWHLNNFRLLVDITYTTTDQGRGCGGNIFNYGGTFTSPMYPMNFRNASDCRWNVTVPNGLVVTLSFREFQIGSASTCETDFLDLIEIDLTTHSESVRAHYCGGDNPALYQSDSNQLAVRYKTSVHNGGTGWVAQFAGVKPGQPMFDNSIYRRSRGLGG